ncbi:MAG: 4Fe-4S binding protein [Bacillota bacterium]
MKQDRMITLFGKWAWVLLVLFLIVGWQYPLLGSIALICMVAPVVMSAWKGGRVWCGNFCPRGSFNDNLLSKIGRSVEIPQFFKSIYFRIGFFIFLIYNFVIGVINAGGDLVQIGAVFYRIVLLTTILTVVLGIIFHERTWCTFCPMGSLSALVVKMKRSLAADSKRIVVDKEQCTGCNLCAQECPMGLEPYNFTGNNDEDLDCLHCEKCVDSCPVDALERK